MRVAILTTAVILKKKKNEILILCTVNNTHMIMSKYSSASDTSTLQVAVFHKIMSEEMTDESETLYLHLK